jgi:hypothetical protein
VKECNLIKTCPFANCEPSFHQLNSIDHFIHDYCNGEKNNECIRIKLGSRNGGIHVPTNMMPNGLPLPGTNRRDWDEVALEYKKHI